MVAIFDVPSQTGNHDHLESKVPQLAARCQQLEEANHYLRAQIKHPPPPPPPQHTPAPRPVPTPPVVDKPLLIASTDPRVRNHPDYPHKEVPRTNRMYKHFQIGKSKVEYRFNQGKIRPKDYGSNRNWDLGLCQEYFETERGYRIPRHACEMRHHPLTLDEQRYMSQLGIDGPRALRRYRQLKGCVVSLGET